MADGIETRETINQGFVRAEIGSGADDKARRVYNGAGALVTTLVSLLAPRAETFVEISPLLLEQNANSAIENYMSAISCYVKR